MVINVKHHIKLILIILLGLIISIGVIIVMTNPLFKSEERIRDDILKLVPLGTSLEEATKVFEKQKKWEIGYKSQGRRSWLPNDSKVVLNNAESSSKLIFVLSDLAFNIVDVIFTFEDDGLDMKLIEVEVRKYISP